MPLSKARNRERMRRLRSVQPKSGLPQWVVQPNYYLLGHLRICPDYNPVQPKNHFDHCPFINPLLRELEPY